jgi:hypothetical protein
MSDAIRLAVYDETRRALADAGGDPAKVDRGAIVKKYVALGATRASVFRWVALAMAKPAAPRPDKNLPPIPPIVFPPLPVFNDNVGEAAPAVVSSLFGNDAIALSKKLQVCVQAATDAMAHSRHPDGRVRLAKSLLAGSEHLRRSLETQARLEESLTALRKMDAYMDCLFAAVGEASPEVQAQVLARLKAVDAKWRSDGSSTSAPR